MQKLGRGTAEDSRITGHCVSVAGTNRQTQSQPPSNEPRATSAAAVAVNAKMCGLDA